MQDTEITMTRLRSISQLFADFNWHKYMAYEDKIRVIRKGYSEKREKASAQLLTCSLYAALLSLVGFYFRCEHSTI